MMADKAAPGGVALQLADAGRARVLRAGPLAVTLEAGALRWITLGDQEILRGIYVAVRGPSWETIVPSLVADEVVEHRDSFAVRVRAEHVRGNVDFAWDGQIEGEPDGTIRFNLEGAVRRAFLRARIGFCVLHPREFAGQPVEIETPWGSFQGRFPTRIAAVSIFNNIQVMRQRLESGAKLEISFEGDLFETEDQRNFGDASFKTYCTPLCLAYPVRVAEGDAIRQAVTVSVVEGTRVGRRRTRQRSVLVEVGLEPIARLPSVGLAAVGPETTLSTDSLARLRTLSIDHVRVEVDADGVAAADQLLEGLRQARAIGTRVELALISDPAATGVEQTLKRAHGLGMNLARVLVYDRTTSTTTRAGAARVRAAAEALGLSVPIGGGSRGWFDLLNMTAIPVDQLDIVTYGVSAEAHAIDDATVMENVATLADTVDSGLAIAAGRPLAVGPVGIAYPFNPWAVGPTPPTPDGMPYGYDRRQLSLFGAAWTLGALGALARPGVATITLCALAGRAGVISAGQAGLPDLPLPEGVPFPTFHVLADLGGFAGSPSVLAVASPPGLACLALRDAERTRVLLANLRPVPQQVSVHMPGRAETTLRILEQSNVERASQDPEVFRSHVDATYDPATSIRLELRPYAVARLERRLIGAASQQGLSRRQTDCVPR